MHMYMSGFFFNLTDVLLDWHLDPKSSVRGSESEQQKEYSVHQLKYPMQQNNPGWEKYKCHFHSMPESKEKI